MGAGDHDPDGRLVLLAKNGNLDAFNSLVDLHQGAVYSLCYRLLFNRESAEDATQETFVAAYRAIARFDGGNLRGWLLRIAANECRDELRRRKRRPTTVSFRSPSDDEPPLDPPDPAPGAPESLESAEAGSDIERLLARLPLEQRQAIVLVDLYNYAYDEVATMTGASVGTVKSRIHRGREKLRSIVEAQPELFGRRRR
jgi:RNA polymerase sigma-70 factor (ECF subfamily)